MTEQLALEPVKPLAPIVAKIKRLSYFDDRFYHFDFTDGSKRALISVTSVLGIVEKPWLLRYYGSLGYDEARRRLREAGDHGSIIHAAAQIFTLGGVVMFQYPKHLHVDDDLKAQNDYIIKQCLFQGRPFIVIDDQWEKMIFDRFEAIYNIVKPVIDESETVVFDMETGTAGTADAYGTLPAGRYKVNGSQEVVIPTTGFAAFDWKSGKNVGHDAEMQVGEYAYCLELAGKRVDYTVIWHLQADTRTGLVGVRMIVRNRDEWQRDRQDFLKVKAVYDIDHVDDAPASLEFKTLSMRHDVDILLPHGIIRGEGSESGVAVPIARTDGTTIPGSEIDLADPIYQVNELIKEFPVKTQVSLLARAFGYKEGQEPTLRELINRHADLPAAMEVLKTDIAKVKEMSAGKKKPLVSDPPVAPSKEGV
jgi:hypothetical protein